MRRFIATALLPFALVGCASLGAQQGSLDNGVEAYRAKDYAAARAQWTIAAEQGDATAQNNRGYLLYSGLAGPADAQRAVALWQQAAAAGHSEAQRHLGVTYAEGIGTEQDLAQAYAWCSCALATAEGANDAAPASVRGRIAADARHCLSVVQGELNEEQMKQGTELAAACRQPRAGLHLVAEDAGVDVRDADGRTALMSASARGDGAVVARLLKEGAQPDLRDQAFSKTALMYAAQNDRGPVAEKLLLAGAGPDIEDNQGWTAFCYAALNLRPGAVLAARGARLGERADQGPTNAAHHRRPRRQREDGGAPPRRRSGPEPTGSRRSDRALVGVVEGVRRRPVSSQAQKRCGGCPHRRRAMRTSSNG